MPKGNKEVTVSKGKVERLPRLYSPFDEMERMFGDFFGSRWPRPFSWARPLTEMPEIGPRIDVIDRDDEVVVRAEVPGYSKEEIEVSVSGDLLTLKGETSREEKEEKGNFYRSEILRGAFTRTVPLPAQVDESKAKASMKDGLLELSLPKLEKSKRRTIKID